MGDYINKITKVIIEKNVTSIGNYAFQQLRFLQEVNMSNIKKIGERAFYNCNSLKKVIMPPINEIQIGKDIFKGCPNAIAYTSQDHQIDLNSTFFSSNRGFCGESYHETEVTWELTQNGEFSYTLIISGDGNMENYDNATEILLLPPFSVNPYQNQSKSLNQAP